MYGRMFLSSLFFVCIFLSFAPELVGFGCSSSGEASASTDIVFEGESYEIKLEFPSLLVDFYKLLNHAERDRMLLVYFTTLASLRTVTFNSELTGCHCLLEEYVFAKQYFENEQEIQRIYVWPFGFTTVFSQANRAQICILLKRTDHMPVHCNLLVNKPCLKKTHISYRKVKSINVDALCNDLSNSDLSNSDLCKNMLSMELNDLVDCYNHTLSSSLDRHAPVNHKTVVKRPTVPWFNEEVKLAKRARRRAERKWRRTKLYGDFLVYKSKKNEATFVMKCANNKYYTTFIQENNSDHRKLFKSAKFLFNQETDLLFPEYSNNTVLANDIGDFFTKKIECIRQELDSAATYDNPTSEPQIMPNVQLDSFKTLTEDDVNQMISNSSKKSCSLDPMPTHLVVHCLDVLPPVITRIINLSLQSGCFPDNWKLAKVHPGLKKSKVEVIFDNLRPISNLSFISKLTERAVFNQTHDHLTAHKLYPKAQSSYRQYHSTETALLCVKNDILMNMNKQHATLLVLLDLSAAFDTVDHTILLNRLRSSFGITGCVLTWLKSYLENRSQCISINGGESRSFEMKYGVPQGSCLEFLLPHDDFSRSDKFPNTYTEEVQSYLPNNDSSSESNQPTTEISASDTVEGATNFIHVDREGVLQSAFEEISSLENLRLTLEVSLYGELVSDLGGPRKEFFMLCLREIQSKYFAKGLRDYMSADYEVVGLIMVLSMLQNGCVPHFLTEEIIKETFMTESPSLCIANLRAGFAKVGLFQIGNKLKQIDTKEVD
ncbi:RNA-directed DNA polymerase from transposon X-element [Paramuricea clavata]|uniref:RNA-directed DNA polymerase from transposon X-element n=1 Tax=Paramuricea clavata TaxID=317549 RepID=A0A7D9HIH2_PARCT|nr:RNA-directed DNA polymerase from transposon X-element [Paramuricea clavata]